MNVQNVPVEQRVEQKMAAKTVILEVVVGSTLHGVSVADGLEDLDIMAVVVEPPQLVFGFFQEDVWTTRSKPEGVRSEAGDVDHVAYGLRKFLGLALKGNPTALLPLFATGEFIRHRTDEGAELQALAEHIISKQVYAPFRGYMRQQHERLLGLRGQRNVTRPELVQAHGYDTKYAAHIVRLGLQGEEVLKTGRLTLPLEQAQRETVLAVRAGKFTLAEVSNKIVDVEDRIVKAYEGCSLPEHPDWRLVQKWMLATYFKCWSTATG